VVNGVVWLQGTVTSDDDIAIVEYLVRDLDDVVNVRNQLAVAEA
jgi:osmotically-inducible protein OsmY